MSRRAGTRAAGAIAALVGGVWAAGVLNGCASVSESEPIAENYLMPVGEGPAVEYSIAVRAYNRQIEHLDRVWARTSVTVRQRDGDGSWSHDQAEGHLQIVRPTSMALTFGKVVAGDVYLLGSDESRYWWLDMAGERKVAQVGRHALATPELARRFGVPVHPLDLIDVLGIVPLPEGREGAGAMGTVQWTSDERLLVVRAPGRFGTREVWIDPQSFRPERVVLYDDRGEIAIRANLDRYTDVRVRGVGGARPRIARQVHLDLPQQGSRVTLEMDEIENRPIRDIAFDFDRLVEIKRIDEVVDLDAPRTDRSVRR